jgi:phenylpropionate dioxygenase-like ring-hydroxylating dioxygenase large terminal subunit
MTSSPVLADGTILEQLIDREKREFSLRVLADPEIYNLELERIWAKAWIVVGHESEISNAGDFVRRRIGNDSVIVVRQRSGDVECLLNVCPHRANEICRTDAGNAPAFHCIYHGWTFNRDGSFRGAPFLSKMFPEGPDREAYSLRKARVEVFCGIIFANWSEEAPTLAEYLGEFVDYLRLLFDRTADGFEILGPPQHYTVPGNWKAPSEQMAGDGYHGQSLHGSLVDLGFQVDRQQSDDWSNSTHRIGTPQGHGMACMDARQIWTAAQDSEGDMTTMEERLRRLPPAGLPLESIGAVMRHLDEKQLRLLTETPPSVGLIFPNVGLIGFHVAMPDGSLCSSFGMHCFVPRGPGKFEFIHWNFVERGASEEFKDQLRRASAFSVGAAGIIEQDDSETWPAMTRASEGFIGRQSKMRYHIARPPRDRDDWLAGGEVYSGYPSDDTQWNWWVRYFDYMTGRAD